MSEKTVFLIEKDNDNRLLLRRSLKDAEYRVSLAIDEEDALERVGRCLKADLVLIDLPGKPPDEVLKIGRKICRAGNINAPIVAIAQKFGEDLEGTTEKFGENEYITYLRDGEQLFELLACLTASN